MNPFSRQVLCNGTALGSLLVLCAVLAAPGGLGAQPADNASPRSAPSSTATGGSPSATPRIRRWISGSAPAISPISPRPDTVTGPLRRNSHDRSWRGISLPHDSGLPRSGFRARLRQPRVQGGRPELPRVKRRLVAIRDLVRHATAPYCYQPTLDSGKFLRPTALYPRPGGAALRKPDLGGPVVRQADPAPTSGRRISPQRARPRIRPWRNRRNSRCRTRNPSPDPWRGRRRTSSRGRRGCARVGSHCPQAALPARRGREDGAEDQEGSKRGPIAQHLPGKGVHGGRDPSAPTPGKSTRFRGRTGSGERRKARGIRQPASRWCARGRRRGRRNFGHRHLQAHPAIIEVLHRQAVRAVRLDVDEVLLGSNIGIDGLSVGGEAHQLVLARVHPEPGVVREGRVEQPEGCAGRRSRSGSPAARRHRLPEVAVAHSPTPSMVRDGGQQYVVVKGVTNLLDHGHVVARA